MDPTTVPFELISFRGLLKSFEDIKRGNFMKRNNRNSKKDENVDDEKMKLDGNKTNIMNSIRNVIAFGIIQLIIHVEKFLFSLMSGYDNYVYTPMQIILSPICQRIPRYIYLGQNNTKIPIFTANLITLARTFLVIPIAWSLKYDYNYSAFFCVIFHDFLDHLDGIVAKVQRITYPNHDDPLLGGFLDAFCDKIVNVLSLWTILQTAILDSATPYEKFMLLLIAYTVMAYEIVIGIVRVEDYFKAQFVKTYKIEERNKVVEKIDPIKATAASMEGKLKEKLESTGIACLCVSISKLNENPISNYWGIAGLICLLLTLRMAHKSLILKLRARRKSALNNKEEKQPAEQTKSDAQSDAELAYKNKINACSADNLLHLLNGPLKKTTTNMNENDAFEKVEMKTIELTRSGERLENEQPLEYMRPRNGTFSQCNGKSSLEEKCGELSSSGDKSTEDDRVDKVYTIGCFDLFHHGHIELLNRMRLYGKKVIVGVHDSRSIYKLKNRVPVDSTEKRMLNVKSYADEVFCVAGCDPSNFISCIVSLNENERALYIRGNDMPNFPSKEIVESLMPIKLLPYTEGVSSTALRKEKFSHINSHDEEYLNKND